MKMKHKTYILAAILIACALLGPAAPAPCQGQVRCESICNPHGCIVYCR